MADENVTKIFSFTWNMHGTNRLPEMPQNADIIMIALQECYAMPSFKILFPEYDVSIAESLFGLQSIILSRKKLGVRSKKFGLGYLGFPNKGFIAIIIEDSILHINTHLAPFECNQKKRMSQISEIFHSTYEAMIDTVVLSGDMNFRMILNSSGHERDSYEGIDNNSSQTIDQAQDFFKVYESFKEAKIYFKPTFKYKGDSFNLKRAPSYCDRIFVSSRFQINFIEYDSMQDILDSDHKPVFLKFEIKGNRGTKQLLQVVNKNTTIRETSGVVYQGVWHHRMPLGLLILILLIYFYYNR